MQEKPPHAYLKKANIIAMLNEGKIMTSQLRHATENEAHNESWKHLQKTETWRQHADGWAITH